MPDHGVIASREARVGGCALAPRPISQSRLSTKSERCYRLAAFVGPAAQVEGGIELERTVRELMARAVAAGSVRSDANPGAVMIVLHGIGSAADRPEWKAESRAAVELLLDGLRAV